LRQEAIEIQTVEHLLSALYGLHIDNCRIEWRQGREMPALDGSARPIVQAILKAGVREQEAWSHVLNIASPTWIEEGGSHLIVVPDRTLRITCAIRFDHPLVGEQVISLDLGEPESYISAISPARTFGFASEVERLRAAGLALGGSLENALVIFDDRFSSEPRFPDECVRHKVLDVIGDLALVGRRLQGHIVAIRPSHRLNTALARYLFRSASLPLDEGG